MLRTVAARVVAARALVATAALTTLLAVVLVTAFLQYAVLLPEAGFSLVLVGRLLAAQRRAESALLRARGASRRQLAGMAGMEAGVVVLPGLVVGPPLATWLVAVADRRAGDRSLGLAADLAPYGWIGPPLGWVIAVAAAAACALALVLPALGRGRTWLAEQQHRSRPSRAGRIQRGGVDVALVLMALLAWAQLQQYGWAVMPRVGGDLGIDPFLALASVLAVVAGTVIVLRLVPLITGAAVRLAERGASFARVLGTWQADRRPHAGPVLAAGAGGRDSSAGAVSGGDVAAVAARPGRPRGGRGSAPARRPGRGRHGRRPPRRPGGRGHRPPSTRAAGGWRRRAAGAGHQQRGRGGAATRRPGRVLRGGDVRCARRRPPGCGRTGPARWRPTAAR